VIVLEAPLAATEHRGCPPLVAELERAAACRGEARRVVLRQAEALIDLSWPADLAACCYKRLADLAVDIGDYDAERLYLRAAELNPDDAAIIEAVARYYRIYRGARGLFAESEAFYLKAERALRAEGKEAGAGPAVGFLVDLSGVALNYSSLVIEGTYEVRHYDHLGELEHYPRIAIRTGFSPP